MDRDVIIIGAGASGLFCAVEAGKRGRKVLVLDHATKVGSKIRISGGGRCNFTNLQISPDHYISQNRHFCRSALSRYSPTDFTSLLTKHGISFHEKEDGQLFCSDSSSDIIVMLRKESEKAGTEIITNCAIKGVSHPMSFDVMTDKGLVQAPSLVIATGGLSYSKLGASDFGFRIARQFAISIIPPRPGLVPLRLNQRDLEVFGKLSGLSFNAEVSLGKTTFRGSLLFTHRGLSGPAILQISSYWSKGDEITINLLPGRDAAQLLIDHRQTRKEVHNMLSQYLPQRFIHVWCSHYFQIKPICQFSEKKLSEIGQNLNAWKITPDGTEGYSSAEVTVGGVDTNEVSSKTMESVKVPGLFFIGEVLDVTGHLGGYNLHWAWASGHAAGQYV